jgi:translation initiation factor 3 subunit B
MLASISLTMAKMTSNFFVSPDHEIKWSSDLYLSGVLPSRTSNAIRWSPRGRHVVLATVGSTSKSELEFWDIDFNMEDTGRREGQASKEEWGNGIQLLGTADHYGVTDVEWDPSGRYLATSASAWTHTVRAFRVFSDYQRTEIPL